LVLATAEKNRRSRWCRAERFARDAVPAHRGRAATDRDSARHRPSPQGQVRL